MALSPGRLLIAAAAVFAVAAGCSRTPAADDRIRVAVTIAPHGYLVERIAGARVSVQVLVPPGQDPHTYDITPQALRELSRSRLYFTAGLEIEKTLAPRVARVGKIRIVDTLKGLEPFLFAAGPSDAHAGVAPGRSQTDSVEGVDPHVWLDPALAARQAETMRDALASVDPANTADYDRGCDRLVADLRAARERIAALLAPHRGARLYVFHPAWGYFAREFGLEQVPVEVEGKEPTARQLADLVRRARQEQVRVVFAEPQFRTASVQSVAREIGARVVLIDDLSADYLVNLERAAAEIAAALR